MLDKETFLGEPVAEGGSYGANEDLSFVLLKHIHAHAFVLCNRHRKREL